MAIHIGRREVISLLGSVAAWPPLAARAQQSAARLPRIGIIDNSPIWDNFRQGLRDLGYIEGQSIVIEYRSAEDEVDRLNQAMRELASLPVDVIAVAGSTAARAAQRATSTIPIVMIYIGDPVRAGFAASLARPGGNMTGTSALNPDLIAKRLEIMKECIPGVARMAFLWNPDNDSNLVFLEELIIAVPSLGLKLISVPVRNVDEFERAFAAMMSREPNALVMTGDRFLERHVGLIINFAVKNRLPSSHQSKEDVIAGGLMSYGANIPDTFRRSASYVHKILKGAVPAELPIEQPTKFELAFNLKTAKLIGVTVPSALLARADEVIE
jgi:putative ABC transport system substrate-binding protein